MIPPKVSIARLVLWVLLAIVLLPFFAIWALLIVARPD